MKKQLSDGYKRSVYWNKDQTIPAKVINNETNIYELHELDADPRSFQQVVFQGKAGKKLRLYTIPQKSKETVLEFCKGTARAL